MKLGPSIELKCTGCRFHNVTRYRVQGDSGFNHYCTEPLDAPKYIGDTTGGATPEWCPLRANAIAEFVETENALAASKAGAK